MTATGSDPRRAGAGDAETEAPLRPDMRPRVAGRPRGPSGLLIGFGMAMLAIVLFAMLNGRRQALEAPQVRARSADGDATPARAVPPLYVPAAPIAALPVAAPAPAPTPTFVLPTPPGAPPRVVYVPQPAPAAAPPAYYPPPGLPSQPSPSAGTQASERSGSGVLVIDETSGPNGDGAPGATPTQGRDGPASFLGLNGLGSLNGSANTARASAGVITNRGTTVAQGTLIPAVLETALDSTRPGFARAIVSRDVRGFDGTRILIPRGSRVFGEYLANAAAGQNRATINWTRLVRPDGVTIAIASPAADALGRGGVKAKVNSHFFARFGAAILQSALQVGVNLASRPADGSVVLALPGQTNGFGNGLFGNQNPPVPTLTIRAGTSITIFAARDLDFTGFGTAR